MRTAAAVAVLATLSLAGCSGTANFQEIADQPLTVSVLGESSRQATCWSIYRQDPVVVVKVHIENLGHQDVGAPDYDVFGLDEEGDDYPMCPHDEPAFAPGDAQEVDLVFAQTDAPCDRLATVVVKQFYQGAWMEVVRLPTGIDDPC